MSSNQIEASALTTFQVDPDGAHVRLHVRDRSGSLASVVFTIACLNQLMMTLPVMVQTALRNSHGDDTLRLVHSLDHFALEAGDIDAAGQPRFILTLKTGPGFTASFAANEEMLSALARSIFEDIPAHPLSEASSLRHS